MVDVADPAATAAAAPAAAEVDFKAEVVRLTAELAKSEQNRKSAEGRLKGRQPAEDMAGIRAEINRLTREFRRGQIEANAEMEPAQKQESLGKLAAEEQTAAEALALSRYMTRIAARINSRLEKASIAVDHPKVQAALEQWVKAQSRDDVDDIYESLDDFIEVEREGASKKALKDANDKAEAARKEANAAKGTLEVGAGAGGGAAGNMTRDNIDVLWLQHERDHPDTANPFESKYRAFVRTGTF